MGLKTSPGLGLPSFSARSANLAEEFGSVMQAGPRTPLAAVIPFWFNWVMEFGVTKCNCYTQGLRKIYQKKVHKR